MCSVKIHIQTCTYIYTYKLKSFLFYFSLERTRKDIKSSFTTFICLFNDNEGAGKERNKLLKAKNVSKENSRAKKSVMQTI